MANFLVTCGVAMLSPSVVYLRISHLMGVEGLNSFNALKSYGGVPKKVSTPWLTNCQVWCVCGQCRLSPDLIWNLLVFVVVSLAPHSVLGWA